MSKLNKKNPFKTPEDYFEGFNDRLTEQLPKESSSIPKEDGFIVPDNYFETLQGSVVKKISAEETKVIPLKPYRKFYYTVASIAAVILVIVGIQWNMTDVPTFEDLANSDIDAYFENNEFGLSMYEIGEVIPVHELEINDILENRFEEEQVLDYLNDNIEDFEALNLEDDE
jgi:hypothetical protein